MHPCCLTPTRITREILPPMEVASPVNNVQRFREAQLMAKAELARRAGVSESTIDRIEAGKGCRMETKRKIPFSAGPPGPRGHKNFPPLKKRSRGRASRRTI